MYELHDMGSISSLRDKLMVLILLFSCLVKMLRLYRVGSEISLQNVINSKKIKMVVL